MPINLTNSDDYYAGTSAAEHIIGRQGNDTIVGGGGSDTLNGWAGDDQLISYGAGGLLSGDTGDDYLEAKKTNYGQYHMYGGEGDDTFVMHLDNYQGWGHQGFHVYGGDQADEFHFVGVGTTNAPMLSRIDDFDASQDSIWVDGTQIDLHALPGNMRIVDYYGQQWLVIDNNVMIGLEGARMYAPQGVPTMMGGAGEMHFHAFPSDLADLETVEFFDQVNFVQYSYYEQVFRSLNQISGTTTTSGADYFYGGSEDSNLNMGGGNDVVNAGKGRDTIRGGGGDDLIAGGMDDDVLYGDLGNDQIWGGSENDSISGGSGNDTLIGGAGADTLDGGSGSDTVSYAGASAPVYVWLDGSTNAGGAAGDVIVGVENLTGGGGADILVGDTGANVLDGGAGNDTIYARGGDDHVIGGAGNDTMYGQGGNDTLDGGSGSDTVSYAGASAPVYVWLDGSTNAGGAAGDVIIGVENLTGGGGADILVGDTGANVLDGGAGNDTIYARGGDDHVIGGAGNDTMYGQGGNDTFVFATGFGNDTIRFFEATNDLEKIDLSAVSAITNWADLTNPGNPHMTQVGTDVVINDFVGNTITLEGVNLADLHEADFLF